MVPQSAVTNGGAIMAQYSARRLYEDSDFPEATVHPLYTFNELMADVICRHPACEVRKVVDLIAC